MRLAVLDDLALVALELLPPADLVCVPFSASAHVIAAVPLEPAARVVPHNPAVLAPGLKGLTAFDTKLVEANVWFALGDVFGAEPVLGKLVSAVVEIFAFKDAARKHFFRGQLGFKAILVEVVCFLADRLRARVVVVLLHLVVDDDFGHDGVLRYE